MKLLLPSIVVLSAFSSVQAESSVYLSPSSSSSSAQAISNSQFASVLAHHLQVADHKLGQFIGKESKIWNWLPTNKQKATDNVNSLFQSKQDEMNLVLHVKGANKIHDLPSSLSHTHSIKNSAPPQAFDALLRTFTSVSSDPLSVFNKGKDWIEESMEGLTGMGKANVDEWDFVDESFSSLHSELSHLSNFFSSSMEEASSKSLTISGLVPIIDSHGQDSTEYSQGLSSLAKILSGGIQSLESSALKAGKKLKVALIISEPETSESISKRSIDSSDEELMERYFLSRQYQATPQSSPLTPFKDDKEKTPESDRFLIRSCFKKEEELEKASASCSGNGKGKESRIGGDMCWRCSCKSSWAGESCSRKDISAQFLLLGGSGLILLMVAFGSIYVLSAEGNQELPGVLAGIQVPTLTRN